MKTGSDMATGLSEKQREDVIFIGQTLAPIFLEDPVTGSIGAVLDAFAALEVPQAADEWPFVSSVEIAPSLSKMRTGAAGNRAETADEFRRLFVGPGRKEAAPWGSVYTDRDGVMFGSTEIALHDWLSAHGVSVSGGHAMPDDHMGTMLQTLAWLAANRPEMVREFLEAHFLTWAPHYVGVLRAASRHPLYEGLAEVTDLTLSGMKSSLQLQVRSVRFYR